jgi:tetratricopeptide (TPR) repeat protein/predicted Ser/Thr protein kinase
MTASSGDDDGNRLERALQLFLTAAPSSPAERDALLRAHPDLADLLAPMCGDDADAATSPTPTAAAPGPAAEGDEQVLGDFRLVRELGRGGMGVVYEAWQRSLDRRVAVKVLAPALVASPSAVARFRREAAAIGRLHHANIVEVHGFGTDGDRHFFAMQLVDGKPLDEVAARFRSPRAAVALCAQLADALAHAHAQGLVHRDVKPANVLVRDDDTPLLSDFGVAHDSELPSVTREGGFVGTLDYASPEQVRGEAIDARTDVWSLGVILYELLTGSAPFAAPTQEALLRNVLTSEPPSLPKSAGVDRDLTAMLARSLSKDRNRRYATAAAFARDLRAWLAGEPVTARLPGAGERLWRWAVREPWRAVAAAAFVLGLPAITASVAYSLAQAPLAQLGESRAAELARQRLLAEVWLAFDANDPTPALRMLPASTAAPDEEIEITRFLLSSPAQRDAQMATIAALHGPAIELLRRSRAAPGTVPQPTTDDPLEWFAAGVLHYSLLLQISDEDERAPFATAVQTLQRASLLAATPQAHVLLQLCRAAARAEDRPTLAAAEQALQRHFGDVPGLGERLQRGRALLAEPQSLEHFERVARQPGPERATMLINVAVRRTQGGDLTGAEAAVREALAEAPENGRAWNRLALVLAAQGRRDESLAAVRRATEVEPGYARHWNALGVELCNRREFAEAETALRRAIELVPAYARAHYNLGYALDCRDALAEAIECYRRTLVLQPDYTKAQINLASALWRTERGEQAYAAAVRAAAMAPNHPLAAQVLAEAAARSGHTDHSVSAARNWIRLEPRNGHAWHRLAMALLPSKKTGDVREVLAAAERAVELAPEVVRFQLLLANARARSGDRRGAEQLLDAIDVNQLDPQDRAYVGELRRFLAR